MEDYIYGKKFLSLIKTRRSVRAYKSEPVPSKALDAVLEAGQPAARKQNYIVRI
jgi:nitroreductase